MSLWGHDDTDSTGDPDDTDDPISLLGTPTVDHEPADLPVPIELKAAPTRWDPPSFPNPRLLAPTAS